MFPLYKEIQRPLLQEIIHRGGSSKPSDVDPYTKLNVFESLADFFNLSQVARDAFIVENKNKRSKWENMVRWAKNDLVKQGLMLPMSQAGYGNWVITSNANVHLAETDMDHLTYKTTPDKFDENKKRAEENGVLGEEIVLKYEIKYLDEIGRGDLADRVVWVAKKNIAAGYDILSFFEDGSEKYIEVKSSEHMRTSFFMSQNEYKTSERHGNRYWLYRVSCVRSNNPIIDKICNPALKIAQGDFCLIATQYRVVESERTNDKSADVDVVVDDE